MEWAQAIMVFIIGSIFSLFYASFTLDLTHAIIKWVMFTFGILTMAFGFFFAGYLIQSQLPTTQIGLPFTVIGYLLITVFIWYFFFNVLLQTYQLVRDKLGGKK